MKKIKQVKFSWVWKTVQIRSKWVESLNVELDLNRQQIS